MDILLWKVAFKSNSGNFDRGGTQPGIALVLRLACRTCGHACEIWHAKTIHPDEVETGKPKNHPCYRVSWFSFSVEHRLSQARYCQECGTASIIPPKMQEPLITAADAAVTKEWLQECVKKQRLKIFTVPEDEAHYAYKAYSSSPAEDISQEWRELETISNA